MGLTYLVPQNAQNFAQATATASGDTLTLQRFITWSYVAIQLSGTWTGTVTFEVTVDGTNWATVSATPSNSTTTATSATANGIWFVQMTGFAGIRCRCSAAMTGTVTMTMKALQSQF